MLTARLPYEGNSLAELALRRENEDPLPPSSYEPKIPEALSAAVLKGLENEQEDRYPDALALAAALRQGLSGIPPADEARTNVVAGGPTTAATRVAQQEPLTPTSPTRVARPRRTAPARRPAPAPAPVGAQPASKRTSGSSLLKGLGAIVLIAIVAALVAAAILLATDAGRDTDLGQFIFDTADQSIEGIRDFIQENTQ